jgi:hypothetical protein
MTSLGKSPSRFPQKNVEFCSLQPVERDQNRARLENRSPSTAQQLTHKNSLAAAIVAAQMINR